MARYRRPTEDREVIPREGVQLVRPALTTTGSSLNRRWCTVETIYDNIEGSSKHAICGRGLGIILQSLVIPTDGEDLTWEDDGDEIFAFPDPIVLNALTVARADEDGLGSAIHLDDYYVIAQIYKADFVDGFWYVAREPFAIFGGPEYEAPE